MRACVTDDPFLNHPDAARIRSRKISETDATLVVDATGLDQAGRSALEARLRDALAPRADIRIALTAAKAGRRTIAIGSGKGGVGKSTLTANLAIACAARGLRVGIIDADIYGPSQPILLGTSERPEARNKQLIPVEAQGVKLLSVGQLVAADQALAWRGPMASGALAQLIEGDWEDCDLLLIDLPPGTGDVQLSLVSKSRPDGAVIVSTPQDLALADATRAIDLFAKTSVPLLGLIENMAGYACPHCGKDSDPFGTGGAQDAAARLAIPFLGRLPLSAALRQASDQGTPPAAAEGPARQAFLALADAMLAELEKVAPLAH